MYKKDEDPALLYALTTAIATRASDTTITNIMKLCNKIPTEFQVVLIRGCFAKDRELKSHNDVRKWITDNANVIL